MLLRTVLFICLLVCFIPTLAQDNIAALSRRRAILYQGPGITFRESGVLPVGAEVNIVERNRVGNWVRVQWRGNETIQVDEWLPTGYLEIPTTLFFSNIPVNPSISDADPVTVRSQSMSALYEAPVLPTISPAMVEIYQIGQEVGNDASTVIKIGDSLAASDQYLTIFSADEHELGPYDHLHETLEYYGTNMDENNIAAQIGLTSYVVFDPFWATSELCISGEDPLDCAVRTGKPTIAFVLFGPNDVRHMTDEEFDGQMRQVVQRLLDHGVIPVLSTFSAHPDEALFWQSINFNLRLLIIADDYQIPLINLWSAIQMLPDYGLDEDRVHLTQTGYNYLKYDGGIEAYSGIALQNLLALATLHEIRLTLEQSLPDGDSSGGR